MLHTEHVCVVEVQETRRAPVGIQLLLLRLKVYARRIVIAFRAIIDHPHETIGVRCCARHRLAKIIRKGRNAAQPRQIVAQEGNTLW